jgi:hypothetical protein
MRFMAVKWYLFAKYYTSISNYRQVIREKKNFKKHILCHMPISHAHISLYTAPTKYSALQIYESVV